MKEAARFDAPTSVAVEAGAAYVTDPKNRRIARIDLATGATTTLLDEAQLGFDPHDVIIGGPPGKLYIAGGSDGNRFHEVDIASKQIVSVAGILQADGLAFNGGTVFFTMNDAMHRSPLPLTSSALLAGALGEPGFVDAKGAEARFAGAKGLVADIQTGLVYVADTGNHAIRAVTITEGAVTTPFGAGEQHGRADGVGPAARFLSPEAVALDGKGNLYVADTGNATIRKIDLATKTVTTIVGQPGKSAVQLGFTPGGLSRSHRDRGVPEGDLVIVDSGENAVLIVRQH